MTSRPWSHSRRSVRPSTTSSQIPRTSASRSTDPRATIRRGNPVRTTTVVVGGGQSGLAVSRCLSARSIDHVILERNDVAHSWRRERWESLRLLTPNWQCRLPGYEYHGDDPDGFMSALEVADFLSEYAKLISAPLMVGATVTSVRRADDGYLVTADQ